MDNKIKSKDKMGANVTRGNGLAEVLKPKAFYTVKCTSPIAEKKEEFINLRDRAEKIKLAMAETAEKAESLNWWNFILETRLLGKFEALLLELEQVSAKMEIIPKFVKFEHKFANLITTEGKNLILDEALAGSGYTASLSIGLIDNASFSAIAAANTMSSHAGWLESTAYSNASRIAAVWAAASAGAKALSSALTFNMNVDSTVINGAFISTNSTKGGTTGELVSAGSFDGGTESVDNGDSLSVSYSISLT